MHFTNSFQNKNIQLEKNVQQLFQPARWGQRRSGRTAIRPHAGPPKLKRPDSGFFAEADPKSDVLPVRSSLQSDPTKRGGRWQSDFIWNSNWSAALDYAEGVRRQQAEGRETDPSDADEAKKGFLSLAQANMNMNRMDVDLSQQLKPRKKTRSGAAAEQRSSKARSGASAAGYATVPATRSEVRQWDRSGKFSRKVVANAPTEAGAVAAAEQLAAENARYQQLKQELQAWAAGLTAACLTATFAFYGRDVAASYGVGALSGLLYLRMLHQSVDAFGSGGVGSALSSNRLLIPIILALGFNRYNLLAADRVGITLQLLPMLVGFFTYKGAVVARQSLALFAELTEGYKGGEEESGGSGSSSGRGGDVSTVDRAFTRKTLMQ